ncbi:MAG: tetratricopeptide repeat protein [Chlorobiaceae bacterium]|nr:tetratricopeptide repeat protein [Chlorobiaceae bacterium]
MIKQPHHFFNEVSKDINNADFQRGLDRLKPFSGLFSDSYLFNLLYAKALKGLKKYSLASEYYRKCCDIAPSNQVAWKELVQLQTAIFPEAGENFLELFDPVTDELEKLTEALSNFEPVKSTETADPTPLADQKRPFPDDMTIAVPTESLAMLFTKQGAYQKAINVYSLLISLKPQNAEQYRKEIDSLHTFL